MRWCGASPHVTGFFSISRTCNVCEGSGRKISKPCSACNGEGRIRRERKLNVKIPPGIDTGSRLKISGEGEAGYRGGARGNLYVFIEIKPHDYFVRDGDDIHYKATVSFTQAALGAEVEVPTLEGRVKLKIPAGTQPGKIFRLAGKGVQNLHGYGKGDELVHVTVDVPTKLSEDEKSMLRQFAELRGETVTNTKTFFEKVKKGFK